MAPLQERGRDWIRWIVMVYRQMEDRLSGGLARKVGCWNIYI